MKHTCLFIFFLFPSILFCQTVVHGHCVDSDGVGIPCHITSIPSGSSCYSNSEGHFTLRLSNSTDTAIFAVYLQTDTVISILPHSVKDSMNILFTFQNRNIDEVVISGTMQAVIKSKSPVAVETYKSTFLRRNIAPTLFESIGMINGIRPQINCNVCNTGDIHMNGMEGPYTLILIDGMPVMSSLASVYGITGIPNSLVERIEVVRGPAASIYGSESMGGLINIITKSAVQSPKFSAENSINSWGEHNLDIGIKARVKNTAFLLGLNTFYFSGLQDNNNDGFTDLANQKRISLFNKINFGGKRKATLLLRYTYENRWGGQIQYTNKFRGGDSIYGESVYTHHIAGIGSNELSPTLKLQYSWVYHKQNSAYGKTLFLAQQSTASVQLIKLIKHRKNNMLLGAAVKHTFYDDNTPATVFNTGNWNPYSHVLLPGIFAQIESQTASRFQYVAGYRLDYHQIHGPIQSPRIALKYNIHPNHFIRLQGGTGFRIVNLFTEEHAAISGDRKISISEKLNPEKSYSGSIQYTMKIIKKHFNIHQEITGYYTYFSNKIIGDFITDPNAIIFNNIHGRSVSRGISFNSDWIFSEPFILNLGVTYASVFNETHQIKQWQFHAPKISGNINLGYTFIPIKTTINISGMINGPMRLPVLPNDFRPEYSPTYCLLNMQLTKKINRNFECYFGIKNLLNFIPQHPLMRPEDPFDKKAADTAANPYGYTFDTSYNYAPLQGRRVFAGIKWLIN